MTDASHDIFRPKDAPHPDHPLLVAARELDNRSDECKTPDDYYEIHADLGLDFKDVLYVARQRALRIVLINSGRTDAIDTMNQHGSTAVKLSKAEDDLSDRLTVAMLDAFLIGWVGHTHGQPFASVTPTEDGGRFATVTVALDETEDPQTNHDIAKIILTADEAPIP